LKFPDLYEQFSTIKKDLLDDHATNQNILKTHFAMFNCEPDPLWVNYYEPLYEGWLRNKGETWKTYKIYENEFPTEDEIQKLKGILISGSDWSVYDSKIPQIPIFLEKLKNLTQTYPSIKVAGICFGCQALAQALGGTVERMKLDSPMLINREKINCVNGFHEKYMSKLASPQAPAIDVAEFYIVEVHGDHVAKLPEGAVLYGASTNTAVEIWGLNDNILGIQGHPEFNLSIMIDKILPEIKTQFAVRDDIEKLIGESAKSLNSGFIHQRLVFAIIEKFLKL